MENYTHDGHHHQDTHDKYIHRGIERVYDGAYVVDTACDMQHLGEALGRILQTGDVLILSGDLGAGKTQLTKGVARSMGVREEVTSPTFTLLEAYQGSEMPLFHYDLYRIETYDELYNTGIFDMLGEGVCLIEWGEPFARELGEERLDVFIERMDEIELPNREPPRLVRFIPCDMRSADILESLQETLEESEA